MFKDTLEPYHILRSEAGLVHHCERGQFRGSLSVRGSVLSLSLFEPKVSGTIVHQFLLRHEETGTFYFFRSAGSMGSEGISLRVRERHRSNRPATRGKFRMSLFSCQE